MTESSRCSLCFLQFLAHLFQQHKIKSLDEVGVLSVTTKVLALLI